MQRTVDRLSLLGRVAALLDRAGARYAVIGAAALAAHGVARSTHDVDLLTLDARCLDRDLWTPLADAGVATSVTRGDADDPLAGVVRLGHAEALPIDLVVGRHRWQTRIIERAQPGFVRGSRLPVAQPRDLIALKLFAGGPQDAWDIAQLLAGPDRDTLVAEVTADLDALPPPCRRLWQRILTGALP